MLPHPIVYTLKIVFQNSKFKKKKQQFPLPSGVQPHLSAIEKVT